MNGRGFHGDYRFGYQGSEKDNEVSGDGNSYTTEFRQLDPRLGRWFSVDPVFQPWQSPYTSMDNNPINLNDPRGLDPKKEKDGKTSNDDKKTDSPSFIKRIATKAGRAIQYGFNWMTGQQYKNDAYAKADELGIDRKSVRFYKNSKTGERSAGYWRKSGKHALGKMGEKDEMFGLNEFQTIWRGGRKKNDSGNAQLPNKKNAYFMSIVNPANFFDAAKKINKALEPLKGTTAETKAGFVKPIFNSGYGDEVKVWSNNAKETGEGGLLETELSTLNAKEDATTWGLNLYILKIKLTSDVGLSIEADGGFGGAEVGLDLTNGLSLEGYWRGLSETKTAAGLSIRPGGGAFAVIATILSLGRSGGKAPVPVLK